MQSLTHVLSFPFVDTEDMIKHNAKKINKSCNK